MALRNLCCFLRLQAHSGCLTNDRCNLTGTRVPISSKSSITRTHIGPYIVLTVGIDVTNGSWGTALVNIYGSKRKTFKNSRQSSSVAISCSLACGNFLIQQVSGNGRVQIPRAYPLLFYENFCHCYPEYCFLSQSRILAQILVNPASQVAVKSRIPLTFPRSCTVLLACIPYPWNTLPDPDLASSRKSLT